MNIAEGRGRPDRIVIAGMMFYGYHGAHPEEKKLGQKFMVDVELEADLAPAIESDNVHDTINYTEIYRVAREILEGPPMNLIERVASVIAEEILANFSADAVLVRVTKLHPPIKGAMLSGASVELYRSRG